MNIPKGFLFFFLMGTGITIVFYLSWLPQPRIGSTFFMPGWLALWVDSSENDTIRTAVPFIFLGALTGLWLSLNKCRWVSWGKAIIGLIVVIFIAEFGQFFLPLRSFDWLDVFWGISGITSGFVIAFLFYNLLIKRL